MRNRSQILLSLATLIMFALLLTICVDNSWAYGPMPYSEDALNKLNGASDKIKAPSDIQNADDHKVEAYIKAYREIFASAGYDYERTMIKIINDIQFERYKVNKVTIKLNGLARELLRLHVKSGVDPRKYLSKDCGELLIEFRNLIRSNMKKYGGC